MATTSSISTSGSLATSFDPAVQERLAELKMPSKKQQLNADDFLKLLTVQLQNQDPLKPMEDAQFMGQMAQFASLEQTRDLNTSFSEFTKQQSISSASQFIGMQVTLSAADASGAPITGLVSAVNLDADGPKIVVNGTAYATNLVTSVQIPGAPPVSPVTNPSSAQ